MLGSNAEGAQPMQDGPVKASHACKLRVYVQRVVVPAKPVQHCLVLTGPLLDHRIRPPAAAQVPYFRCLMLFSQVSMAQRLSHE